MASGAIVTGAAVATVIGYLAIRCNRHGNWVSNYQTLINRIDGNPDYLDLREYDLQTINWLRNSHFRPNGFNNVLDTVNRLVQANRDAHAAAGGASSGVLPHVVGMPAEMSEPSAIPQETPLTGLMVLPELVMRPGTSSSSVSLQWVDPLGGSAGSGGRRLQTCAPRTFTNVDSHVIDLVKLLSYAQSLAAFSSYKAELLQLIGDSMMETAADLRLNADSKELLNTYLAPAFTSECDAVAMWHLDHEGAVAMLGNTKNLSIGKLGASPYDWTWNINFHEAGNYLNHNLPTVQFNTASKPVFVGTGTSTRSVHLDDQHTQYTGSPAKELITIAGNGGTTFNIATGDGDDTIIIPYQIFTDANSVVNILGGAGKNTYIIQVKDGWNSLAGSIHIWDFDPSKDTIVFQTSESFATPNIRETKRTVFASDYGSHPQVNGDGTILLSQAVSWDNNYYNYWLDTWHYTYGSSYHAAQHEFTGDGVALLKLDESSFDFKNPDKFFANPNAFKSDGMGDIAGNTQTGAELLVNTLLNTQFSQLDTPYDHDWFRVHLLKGESYVFKMEHRAGYTGDGVLTTSLKLKDSQGNDVAPGDTLRYSASNGNARIDFLAADDGDYFLDASSTGTQTTGKYSISGIEIPHSRIKTVSTTNDTFDTQTGHVGYTLSLSAGDYVQLTLDTINKDIRPNVAIHDAFGNDIHPSLVGSTPTKTIETFLANKAGDYYMDANVVGSSTANNYVLSSTTLDVEGDSTTKACLSANSKIINRLDNHQDHDWYRVTLDAGKTYQFDMQRSAFSNSLDTYLRLRDINGNQLAFNDDISVKNTDSRLTYKATTSGEYFLDAASYAQASSGDYSLSYKVI